ncbi:TetR/AcrR family transcriptional regulator [Nocardiopsis coralliicola]
MQTSEPGRTRPHLGGAAADGGPAAGASEGAPSRRARVREATLAEIRQTARRQLVQSGPDGISLRAIARDMGMTAPGLYRYHSSLSDLLAALRAELFTELADAVRGASAALPAGDTDGRVLTALRAFRRWALDHPAEFGLLFGAPGTEPPDPDPRVLAAAQGFAATFFALFDQVLAEERFTLPADATVPDSLRAQLDEFAGNIAFTSAATPYAAQRLLMSLWVRLYGLVCMEVFQHMRIIMGDMEPLFEAELADMLTLAGLEYRPPGNA